MLRRTLFTHIQTGAKFKKSEVQISIDGVVWRRVKASQYRSDVGPHAFGWEVDVLFGSHGTNHTIEVVAFGIGTDGRPDGVDATLSGGGGDVAGSCASVPKVV